MRLFIAARPDAASMEKLLRMQKMLCDQNPESITVSADNLHMTLAFLGEISDPEMIGKIVSWIRDSGFQMRSLNADGFECWRNLIVLKLRNSQYFKKYVSNLRKFLAENGIRSDQKLFEPHITLVKKAVCLSHSNGCEPDTAIVFEAVALFESKTVNGRLIYTEIS